MTARTVAILFVNLFVFSCHSTPTATLITSTGSCLFKIELADSPQTRRRGLMDRTELDNDTAMLFVWGHDVSDPFWMKNTPLPLDIIFIDHDKKVVCIASRTTPYSTDLIHCPHHFRFVLETNAGHAEKCGLKVGDEVIIR